MKHNYAVLMIVMSMLFIGIRTDIYAQESSVPEEQKTTDLSTITKDMAILKKEIRKVRASVSALTATVKSLKAVSQAVTELNGKLESQIKNVNALSGELYRIGSTIDQANQKKASGSQELTTISENLVKQKQSLKDMQDEVLLLREMCADLQNRVSSLTVEEKEEARIKKFFAWKYWGSIACGIALAAVIIAL